MEDVPPPAAVLREVLQPAPFRRWLAGLDDGRDFSLRDSRSTPQGAYLREATGQPWCGAVGSVWREDQPEQRYEAPWWVYQLLLALHAESSRQAPIPAMPVYRTHVFSAARVLKLLDVVLQDPPDAHGARYPPVSTC